MTADPRQDALHRIADVLSDLLKVIASPPIVVGEEQVRGARLVMVRPTSAYQAEFLVRVFSQADDEYQNLPVDARILMALRPDLDHLMNGWRTRHPDGMGIDASVLGGRELS